ncbi:MAG: T9SS type A sorting domain-containing protein [Ignavibacteria bacterium]
MFRINNKYQIVALGVEETNPEIFVSGNNGESWQGINNELPQRNFFRGLAIDSIGRVLIGTDSGLYRSLDPVLSINETKKYFPSAFILEQNYPNPFNPSTNISFKIPVRTNVTLKIFDVIGREVATIVSGEMPAGKYTRTWDASDISGAIYFYRLQTPYSSETKKLILLK